MPFLSESTKGDFKTGVVSHHLAKVCPLIVNREFQDLNTVEFLPVVNL
jgi:hypothetical protein